MDVATVIAAGKAIISASGVVEVVKSHAVSFAKEEFKGLWDLRKNVNEVSKTLESIEADLKVAEERQDESEDIRKWLQKLKNVAYDLEDVLDDYALEGPAEEEENMGALTQWTRLAINSLWLLCDVPLSCFGIATPVTPLRNILHRLQSIKKELEEVNKRKESLGGGASSSVTTTSEATTYLADKGRPMVGRYKVKEKIKATLLNPVSARVGGSSPTITVVGIAGLGGMGKTTLAQDIFSDQELVEKFSFRKWVDVGVNFDAESVIDKIIRKKKDDVLPKDLCDLQSKLIDKIKDKRFLIVLDNAWCTDDKEWDKLWRPLTHGEGGGALVVTARDRAVARAIPCDSAYSEHLLGEMPEGECLEILKRSALKGQRAEGYHHRELQCEQIVEKLKGVPLAADIMGRFLGKHLDNENIWRNVVTDEGWSQKDEEELVHRVNGLSYRHLPSHLKPCFAYCSIFPKGFIFDKETLVRMWVAQGYIQDRENQLMEHIGSVYFDNLCQMSFFQLKPSGYVMHDIVYDFAQKIFPEGRRRMDAADREAPEQVRHLSLHVDGSDSTVFQNLQKYKKLRTLMIYASDIAAPALDVLREFKYIRVLALAGEISEFPDSIGHLKLLRYLDISETNVEALPKLVCNLLHLQVLKLPLRCELPEETSKLVNLRCLLGAGKDFPNLQQLGRLTSLQVLRSYHVPKQRGRIKELGSLNNLHGSLYISDLENLQSKEEALLANLKDKVYLEKLLLEWESERGDNAGGICSSDSQVLEGLCPPPNLKELIIRNNLGAQPPSWMKEQHQLSDVTLSKCSYWNCLPPLGQLPLLKSLILSGAKAVKKVGPEFFCVSRRSEDAFPHLKHLSVFNMDQWEGWDYMPVGRVFPSLRKLDLGNCPKLTSLSPMLRHMTTLTELKIRRCTQLSSLEEDGGEEGNDDHGEGPPSSYFPPLQRFSTDNRCSLKWVLCQKLRSLKSLEITDLHNDLICFTEDEEEGWKHLTSLSAVTIRNCPQLESLPSSMHILPSLHLLILTRCFNINRLPDGGLPASLRLFHISRCPKLRDSCRRGGPDHHKIPSNAKLWFR